MRGFEVVAKIVLFIVAWGWIFGAAPYLRFFRVKPEDPDFKAKDRLLAGALIAWMLLGYLIFRHVIPVRINPFCSGNVCEWHITDD